MYIDSTSNKIIKSTKKLLERNGRKEAEKFIIEGKRLVNDAVSGGADIEFVLVEQGTEISLSKNILTYELSHKAFSALKSTVNSQGVIAVARMPHKADFSPSEKDNCLYIYLDGVSDPGNMGTIIRTADATGADGIVVSASCVDVYNPKVVRSTMASIFNVPIYFDDAERSVLKKMKKSGIMVISGSLSGEKSLYDVNFKQRCVAVIGNEANGITNEVIEQSDILIKIPIIGKAESLNAAVACAVIAYERLRQNL